MLWFAPFAWLGHAAPDVLIETEGGVIIGVQEGAERPTNATLLDGFTLPGLVNAHSHAFHRALRGATSGRDFWAWRDEMYRLAAILDPERYHALARATYAEMALAGITTVGEFHYLHREPGGAAYSDPNEMGRALLRAAADAGIRITLLDTCYLRGDFDRPLEGPQIRFSDGSAAAWAERVALFEDQPHARIGGAIHSVRAVDQQAISEVADWAKASGKPLHVHVSEQPAENERCLAATGLTPTHLLAASGVWEATATALHATHTNEDDIGLLGQARARVCVCPTTERDLADGIGPSSDLATAGAQLCVGTDSHARIDLLEEARLLELHERLLTGHRGTFNLEELIRAATVGGADSLGWSSGRLDPGAPADFAAFRLDSPRTAGASDQVLGRVLYGAAAADLHTTVVAGRIVVREGAHQLVEDPSRELTEAIEEVRART
ncbi:MAG: formimidoylglutamate deiminase [Acidimicrobiia bacterium]